MSKQPETLSTTPRTAVHFVHYTHPSIQNNDQSRFQARAHTARVNRKRRRQALLHSAAKTSSKRVVQMSSRPSTSNSICRTLSPVFGGFATEIFQPENMPSSSLVLHYNLTVIYPSFIHRPEVLSPVVHDRLRLFCEFPTLFHSYHFTAAAHYDITRNQLDWYERPDMIWHKAESIRHLREMIARIGKLDRRSIEIAIVAIMYLEYGEVTNAIFDDFGDYLFDPPAAPLNWMENCWNRMIPSEAHAKAIYLLIDFAGGLHSLQTAALATNLGRWDLRRASIHLEHPRLASMWAVSEPVRDACRRLQSMSTVPASHGFQASILTYYPLPPELIETLVLLAGINWLVFDTVSCMELGHHQLRDARSAVHHQLLSMPAWHELEPDDKRKRSDFVTYECCRLTAIIYSNAILLGLPPQTGWLENLVPQLRSILESESEEKIVTQSCHALVFVWVLLVGAMAAQGSVDATFFKDILKEELVRQGLKSWTNIGKLLHSFIWSTSACGRGAAVIWAEISEDVEKLVDR